MIRRPPSPVFVTALALLAVGGVLPSRAQAACTLSACDAGVVTAAPACCTASSCTIDGTLTVSGPTCTFDFGTRNLIITGQVAAQGKAVTLKAKSVKLTGLIDVRGPSGANAGSVTIVTTGMTAVAYSQEGGTSAVIDASSSAGAGGLVAIQADGAVMLSKGSITANGGPAAVGGRIDLVTTSGDVTVQIPVSASGGVLPPAGQPASTIGVTTPGNLTVGGSGRFVADGGSITVAINGLASFAAGAVMQSNLGGDITMRTGSLTSFAEFRANGDFGTVDLETTNGPITLSLLSQGITVGVGGSVTLTTDSNTPDGTITVDMPIVAPGASVDVTAAGSIVVSKKIITTGILDSGGADMTFDAGGDVHITKAIVGSDVYSVEDIDITALGDILIEGNIEMKGGLDADGGQLAVTAGGNLTVQGDIVINVSGADYSSGGGMDLEAARNLTIANTVQLIADGSASDATSAGSVNLEAGIDAFGAARLPGTLTLAGDIKANGHSTFGNDVTLSGCNVAIPSGAVIDITGDLGSTTTVTARSGLTIAGQLKATGANILEFAQGVTPVLTGSTILPAPSPGGCTTGTPLANGCRRPVCTGDFVPAGCLFPCPSCGDGVLAFPETCEIGAGGTFCSGSDFCNEYCQTQHCVTTNPCVDEMCDAALGCQFAYKADGASCSDNNVCNGLEQCQGGACGIVSGSVPSCGSDGNACTTDGCDAQGGCFHMPITGTGIAGCDDANPCTGTEACMSGICQPGTLVTCQGSLVCNPATGQCEGPGACLNATQCNDNNACTTDTCVNGFCSNVAESNTSCDDNDLCNGVRTCQSGVCQPPTPPVNCNDANPCTTDSCNPLNGACIHDPVSGCCASAADCNDANACTTDACSANTCSHTAITCNDGNACTDDLCAPATGCQFDAVPNCQLCITAATCGDDTDVCTDKACVGGRCAQVANPNCCNTPADCLDIDSNPCTDNGTTCINNRCADPIQLIDTACGTPCNPATCRRTCSAGAKKGQPCSSDGDCDDGTPQTCDTASTCVLEAPMDCSDPDPCTTDVCTDDKGCTHTPIDQCCLTTGPCNDQNACTEDTCDLDANRCAHVIPDPTCLACPGDDPFFCGPRCLHACQAGRCVDFTANCDDANPCTADACDPEVGCTNMPLDTTGVAGCDDGQACNGAERCVAGACQTQPNLECDDGDVCTDDTCADVGGCIHTGKISYDGIRCRILDLRALLNGAGSQAMTAKLHKSLVAKLPKIEKKLDKAAASGTSCPKSRSLLAASAKQLRAFQRTVNRSSGRQITDVTLAAELARRAGEAATHADETRNDRAC